MPRILLIDDNAENRDWLSRRLERRGFEVLVAVDGRAGIDMALAEKPDLVLMDMNMPQVDGWEATRQIKSAMPIDFDKLLSQIELLLESGAQSPAPPAPTNSNE